MAAVRSFLGQILKRKKLITDQALKEALEIQKKTGEFLGAILIAKGIVKEAQLLEALSEQLCMPLGSIEDIEIDWELAAQFSKSLILDHRCFPVSKTEDAITLALTNPLDAWPLTQAQKEMPGFLIKPILVSARQMDRVIEMYRNYSKSKIRRLLE